MKGQKQLFDFIKNTLNPEVSLATELEEALKISLDSAYRRIRCETALTFDEACIISSYFGVSLDEVVSLLNQHSKEDKSQLPTINFRFQKFTNDNFMPYLEFIYNEFKSSLDSVHRKMTLTCKDIPSFYFFLYPELMVFKAYFYGRIMWPNEDVDLASFDYKSFSRLLNSLDPNLQKIGSKIIGAYTDLPSSEIWGENTLDGHLSHILYAWKAGYFEDKENALLILNKTKQLVDHIQLQAKKGYKFLEGTEEKSKKGEFEMYYSEGLQLENTILTSWEDHIKTYMIYNTGDYLMTTNEHFSQRVETYITNMMKQTHFISKVGEQKRNLLFKKITDKIKVVENRIHNS